MATRVFLLVVEDMDTDRLISTLEEMQLRRMGRFREVQERTDEKIRVQESSAAVSMEMKSPKKFWKSVGGRNSELRQSRSNAKFQEEGEANVTFSNLMDLRDTHHSDHTLSREVEDREVGSKVSQLDLEASQQTGFYYNGPPDADFPMEFEALELLASAAFEQLDSDIAHLELGFVTAAANVLSPTTEGGEDLHILSNHVRLYADRVTLFDKVFDEILASPEAMVRIEISRNNRPHQKQNPVTPPDGVDPELWNEFVDAEDVSCK